jgi:hypothetical protein
VEQKMDEHTKELGEALGRILDAIMANELQRAEDPLSAIGDKPVTMTMDDLIDGLERGDDWVRDPIGQSLRAGLRKVGTILAQSKTTSQMKEVVDHVSRKDDGAWRSYMLDKHSDGITNKDGDTWIS